MLRVAAADRATWTHRNASRDDADYAAEVAAIVLAAVALPVGLELYRYTVDGRCMNGARILSPPGLALVASVAPRSIRANLKAGPGDPSAHFSVHPGPSARDEIWNRPSDRLRIVRK